MNLGFFILAAAIVVPYGAAPQPDCSEAVTPGVHAAPLSSEQKHSAEVGDPKSQFQLAMAYEFGCGLPANLLTAAKWMRRSADQGYAQAQNDLGVMYRMGQGVPKDLEQAVKWYRLAAKQGEAAAAFNLGTAYFNGEGVGEDPIKAFMWMTAAKDGGSDIASEALGHIDLLERDVPLAELQLSELYIYGAEVPKNDERGIQWLKRAADHKSGQAQFRLGIMHINGTLVPQNDAEALFRFHKAADQMVSGQGQAWYWIAFMHENGRGVQQNVHEAIKLYEIAAVNGNQASMSRLALIYESGADSKPDLEKAYMWLLLARAFRDPQAEQELTKVASQISPKTIAKAEEDARRWNTQHWRGGLTTVLPRKKN